MNKIFIDKEIKVYHGQEAENLISQKNDSIYIENGAILKVPKDRWIDAQHYEKKTWMGNPGSSDDRNYEHYERFDSYKALSEYQKDHKIEKAIELGCGPFTNIRTILDILPNLKDLHLLDPLINVYFDEQDVEKMVYQIYDTGHPIKVSLSYLNEFLSKFNQVFSTDLHGLYGQEWRHDKYFIGIKK